MNQDSQHKMKNKYANILLLITGSLAGFLFIEILSFSIRNTFLKNIKNAGGTWRESTPINSNKNKNSFPYKTNRKFRLSRPLPYLNSKYFEWYVKETMDLKSKCKSEIYHDGRGFNLNRKDVVCKGFEFKNNWRKTTNVPRNANNNIYIFGGSTVVNSAVPNEFTIASIIQKNINDLGIKYRVNNRGFTTVTTNQQNDFLYKTNIKKGDIVIYYDGGNNQWQGVANNLPNGTIIGTNRKIRNIKFIKKILSNLQTYKLLSDLKYSKKKDDICEINYKNVYQKSDIAFDAYKENLSKAKDFVTQNGGEFFHFYQPNLFSLKSEEATEYERKLQNTTPSEMVPCGASFYLSNSSMIFSKRHPELIKIGINSKDISNIFSKGSIKRAKNEEYFLDWIHLTEKGNYHIANAILKNIFNSNHLKFTRFRDITNNND